MAMKKATKERITAAYDKGFADGEKIGHQRAEEESKAIRAAAVNKVGSQLAFADSLDKEADPE